jgi:hypothetical protein
MIKTFSEDRLRAYAVCSYLEKEYGRVTSVDPIFIIVKTIIEKLVLQQMKNEIMDLHESIGFILYDVAKPFVDRMTDESMKKKLFMRASNFIAKFFEYFTPDKYVPVFGNYIAPYRSGDINIKLEFSAIYKDIKSNTVHYVSFFPLLTNMNPKLDLPTLAKIDFISQIKINKHTDVKLHLFDLDFLNIVRYNVLNDNTTIRHEIIEEDLSEDDRHFFNTTLEQIAIKGLYKIPYCQNYYCPIRKACQQK